MNVQQIRDLIARNQIEKAIESLRATSGHSDLRNDIDLVSGQYFSWKQNWLEDPEKADATINQIRMRVLDILSEFEQSMLSVTDTKNLARIAHLHSKINGLNELIKEWEDKRDVAENPSEIRRCEQELIRLNNIQMRYMKELGG